MTLAEGWRSIWQAPHRPLFFLAGLWALVAPIVWLLPDGIGPGKVAWHRHELLFGMASAAAGGYLLTALSAWTKRGPVPPPVSMLITFLWFVGRLTVVPSVHLPSAAAAIGTSAYFAALTAILAHGVMSCGAWRRIWAPLSTAALGIHALLLVRGESGFADVGYSGTVPTIFIILIILIGGRAIPAFTRSWLYRTGAAGLPRDRPTLSYLAIAGILLAAYLAGDNRQGETGVALVFSGAALLQQMRGWQSLKTYRYPALFILHFAFAWTPTALLLGGFAAIFPERLAPAAALHAFTMGAMGTMMIAIMMRAAMIRAGETLALNRTMTCAFALVCVSAVLRVLAGWISAAYFDPIVAAAVCWMLAWALFLAIYLPALTGPVLKPALSAATKPLRPVMNANGRNPKMRIAGLSEQRAWDFPTNQALWPGASKPTLLNHKEAARDCS